MLTNILLIPFSLAGLAGFVGFFIKFKQFMKIRGYTGRTRAEVVAVKEEVVNVGKDETETYYSPIVTYRVDNVLYRKTFSQISEPAKQRIGSLIPIRYDRKNPSNFAPEKMTELFAQTFGLLFVGVGMVIFIANVLL